MEQDVIRKPPSKLVKFALAAALLAVPSASASAGGQDLIDILAYFKRAQASFGARTARKTKPVDVRPAKPGEIIVTMIKGEGKETQSPPAKEGDMVVRNRCPHTGNEEILVAAAKFPVRYEGPVSGPDADGWLAYTPKGVPMQFVIVAEKDGSFRFMAPWGETMAARPGDAIVQDPANPSDTYRVAKAAFACTYEIVQH